VVSIGRGTPEAGPRKGDIFVLEFPDIGGHVQSGRRPGVAVQADRLSRSGTVIMCPITSAPPRDELRRPHRVPVARTESGLDRDGWVKADQLVTVPVTMLTGPVGRLAPAALDRVDAALRFVLDLEPRGGSGRVSGR
jgi:mRNA-degrading endonuclease toxin of MazEF toxin-antitoxin module